MEDDWTLAVISGLIGLALIVGAQFSPTIAAICFVYLLIWFPVVFVWNWRRR